MTQQIHAHSIFGITTSFITSCESEHALVLYIALSGEYFITIEDRDRNTGKITTVYVCVCVFLYASQCICVYVCMYSFEIRGCVSNIEFILENIKSFALDVVFDNSWDIAKTFRFTNLPIYTEHSVQSTLLHECEWVWKWLANLHKYQDRY